MKIEDVKIGMRVIPFQKTVAISGGFDFNFWLNENGRKALDDKGYVTVSDIFDFGIYFEEAKGAFSASDFNPYTETPKAVFADNAIKKMLTRGNRTVVFLQGARKGESVCNSEDTFDAVKGLALAYMRALGQKVDDIRIEINPCVSACKVVEDKPVFEVGDLVTGKNKSEIMYEAQAKIIKTHDMKIDLEIIKGNGWVYIGENKDSVKNWNFNQLEKSHNLQIAKFLLMGLDMRRKQNDIYK